MMNNEKGEGGKEGDARPETHRYTKSRLLLNLCYFVHWHLHKEHPAGAEGNNEVSCPPS